jgi:hypothetical protein
MTGGVSPVNLSPPVISGIGLVGETLSSTLGTWSGTSPISYSYQWKRNGSPILGAISSTYLLVAADADTNITCTVTATNTVGSMSSNSNSISVIGYDPSAYAFFQATGITDPAIKDAVDILVTDLKGYGIWDKMKAIYPFVGGTPTTHKFNLKDPRDLDVAFRLAFNGGWTHSSNGALPNGTNGFANTFVTPSTNLSQDSTHASVYSRTNNTALINRIEIGSSNGTIDFQESIRWDGSLGNLSRLNNAFGVAGYLPTKTSGYFITSRTASSTTKKYEDNVLKETNSAPSSSPNAVNITLAGRNTSGVVMFYDAKQYAFATIGDGLTDTEASNLYTRVQAFQTTLSRNI